MYQFFEEFFAGLFSYKKGYFHFFPYCYIACEDIFRKYTETIESLVGGHLLLYGLSIMPKRNELRELARIRLRETKALFDCALYDGSCYLAGYVIELALKARICRILDLDMYPDSGEVSKSFKTHNLDHLLKLAGLERKFERAKASNPNLLTNWSLVTEWNENVRYMPVGSNPKIRAENIISSLEDITDGVFVWIKKYW